ncbi:DUF72 domain-containing protein [Patulibacter sp. SYSU D01012]|uniref:DUF72 domain-containing protein n=1 Tax=Patulibacter sp. SYSU D01012 TaxID=2817381 RepID=UPI001B3143B4|nr:DUF72 domain-containing protein [Patulibacter sp. SYSU D01012]
MPRIRIGCSGWNYAWWRDVLYPRGLPTSRWLARYAEWFDTVEVNATFYRLQRPTAVAAWLDATPDDFVFAVKASQYLTHMKRLRDVEEGIARFYAPLEALAASPKMGPVLWQLPERFPRDDDRLQAAIELLPPGRHAWEFRHPSWFCAPVYDLLARHGMALAYGDHPDRPFQEERLTADFAFVRFHHGHRGRRGNYSRSELEAWAGRLERLARGAEVFAYFNNDWEAFALRDARWLARRLGVGPGAAAPAGDAAPTAHAG